LGVVSQKKPGYYRFAFATLHSATRHPPRLDCIAYQVVAKIAIWEVVEGENIEVSERHVDRPSALGKL
jgi:hypothetical protein